jgi:hypothetical protein
MDAEFEPRSASAVRGTAEDVAGELIAEASLRAREQVLDWLTARFVAAYQVAVESRLAESGPVETRSVEAAAELESGYYVYAVTTAVAAAELGTLAGIDGALVTVVRDDGLGDVAALVSTISLDALRDAATADISATGSLARVARAHDAVACAAVVAGTVLPTRFGTVFPSPATLSHALDDHHDELSTELTRLAGSTEWAIKLIWAGSAEVARAPEELSAPRRRMGNSESGTAWMLSRHADYSSSRRTRARIEDGVDAVCSAMRAHVREVGMARRADGSADSATVSFLVDDVPGFRSAFAELEDRSADDVDLSLSGPLPPYHFTRSVELSDPSHA